MYGGVGGQLFYPASQVYVRGKINDCAQCGIESCSINLSADTTQETLLEMCIRDRRLYQL